MATIVTRSGKGSPLTNAEVDANFTNLNDDKAELSGANFTGSIDVTGTVTADGLTVGGSTDNAQYAELSSSGLRALRLSSFSNNGNDNAGHDINASSSLGAVTLSTGGTTRFKAENNGDISFYEDTGTTPKFFWDASTERLGIGTSSPANQIEVVGSNNSQMRLTADDANPTTLSFDTTTGSTDRIRLANDAGDFTLAVQNTSEAMRIDSSGNVGIGTSSPATALDVVGTVTADGADLDGAVVINESGADVDFRVESDTRTHALFVEGSSGNVGIATDSPGSRLEITGYGGNPTVEIAGAASNFGSSNPAYLRLSNLHGSLAAEDSIGEVQFYSADLSGGGPAVTSFVKGIQETISPNQGALVFGTGSTANERMRIDSSGNVGIGTTSPSQALDVVGNIEVSGGVYLGGTGAANLLDDYEEGTWTPTYEAMTTDFSAITYDSLTAGRYTKIGNKVFIEGVIRTDSITIGSAAGAVYIQGLPFTVNGADPNAAVSISVATNFAGDMPSSGQCVNGTNGIELRYRTVANGATLGNDPADFNTGANTNLLVFSGHYTV